MKVSIPTLNAASKAKKRHSYPLHPWLAGLPGVLMLMSPARTAFAEDYFNPAALEFSSQQQKTADLHYFSREGGEQPGTYHVTVLLNNNVWESRDVTFVEGRNGLVPLLTVRQLAEMGVNVRAFSAFDRLKEGETIQELGDFIPDASTRFDFSQQQLTISIPQIALTEKKATISIRQGGMRAFRRPSLITPFPAPAPVMRAATGNLPC